MWAAFVNRCLIVNCVKGGITQVYVQNLIRSSHTSDERSSHQALIKYHLAIHKH